MEALTRAEIVVLLRELNPSAPAVIVQRLAAHVAEYQKAQRNIDENGAVVLNPKNRTPVQNPYLSVRAKAEAAIVGILKDQPLNTAGLWGISAAQPAQPAKKSPAGMASMSSLTREQALVRLIDDLEEDVGGMNSDVARVQGRAAIARHHGELSALREATAKAREEAERRKGGALERIQSVIGGLEPKQLRQLQALIASELGRAPAH